MPTVLSFFCPGKPVPQGSKRIVRGRMIESARGHRAWRESVAMAALAARQKSHAMFPLTSYASVTLRFCVPGAATAKPDIDKLARAVLDALTEAGIIRDDAIVISLSAEKHRPRDGERPGVDVRVTGE